MTSLNALYMFLVFRRQMLLILSVIFGGLGQGVGVTKERPIVRATVSMLVISPLISG